MLEWYFLDCQVPSLVPSQSQDVMMILQEVTSYIYIQVLNLIPYRAITSTV